MKGSNKEGCQDERGEVRKELEKEGILETGKKEGKDDRNKGGKEWERRSEGEGRNLGK